MFVFHQRPRSDTEFMKENYTALGKDNTGSAAHTINYITDITDNYHVRT